MHLAEIKFGLSPAVFIAQGQYIEIVTYKTLYVQVDGEPFKQEPAHMGIALKNR
jgi:hypothetical protein